MFRMGPLEYAALPAVIALNHHFIAHLIEQPPLAANKSQPKSLLYKKLHP